MNENITEGIPLTRVAAVQKKQWKSYETIRATVPAKQEKTIKLLIDGAGDFLCEQITGSYETLKLSGADIIDNGVCSMRVRFEDVGGNRKLTNDFVPLNHILTPGRRKSNKVTIVDNSPYPNAIFLPLDFELLILNKSSLSITVKNDSDVAQDWEMTFWGTQFKGSAKA